MSESETKQLTCPNGHSFDAPDSDDALTTVACPECDADVDIPDPSSGSRGRGLWAMMGQPAASTAETSESESPTDADDAEPESESGPALAGADASTDAPVASGNIGKSAEDAPADTKPEVHSEADDGAEAQSEDVEIPERPAFLGRTKKVLPIEAAPQAEPDAEVAEPSDDTSGDTADEGTADPTDEAEAPTSDDAPARGLWAMMGVGAKSEEPAAEQDARTETEEPESAADREEFDTAPPKPVVVKPVDADSDSGQVADAADDDDGLADEDEEDGWDVEDPQEDLDGLESLLPPPVPSPIEGPPPGHGRSIGAVSAGVAALLLSGLTVLPWFWVKVPGTLAGIGALIFGYQAIGERNRAREKKPATLAMTGMALGLAGMFAGPAYLNELGENHRKQAESDAIKANLVTIGEALDRYYAEHARYPSGGDWEEIDGIEVPMHGWMTSLMPYLDQDAIVSAIDRTKPWDHPDNFPAMSQPISTFLVPNVEHAPTSQGFATTHYAGVGGEILTDEGRYSLGIFGRDSQVTLQDITDGRSQTLVAGEIARNYPAWGSTGNWRQTGRGLTKDIAGFGNVAGTGAHFLMADGSVRFFSKRTSQQVLDRLSTRDAGDDAMLPGAE